jgi:hypothetical protein
MIRLDVQGFGILKLRYFVSDFSCIRAEDGVLLPGIKEKLRELSEHPAVYVITSDTFGKAREELRGVTCRIQVLEGHSICRRKRPISLLWDLTPSSRVATGTTTQAC